MDVAQTEMLIREKLESTGQLNKMRAMVIDASLRAIAGSSTSDAQELFATSPNMQKLRETNPEELKKIVSVAVECLQWLGLAYSANVVSVESGIKPIELTKRDGLAAALGLSSAAGSPSIIGQLLAGGGAVGGAAAAAAINNVSAVGNTTTNMTSFGSADVSNNKYAAVNNSSSTVNSSAANTTTSSAAAAAANTTTTAAPVNPHDFEDTSIPKPDRKSLNSKHEISRWNNRTFKRWNNVKGDPMNIDYLENCKVLVLDDLDSTNIDDCKNTTFVFSAVASSIFLRSSENCTVYAACKQFRVRDCTNCTVHLFAGTDPVVESSSNIVFKPFNLRLPGLITSFKNAKLDAGMNRYVHVYDFNAEDTRYPEPHYVVKHEHHGLDMEDWCSEDGEPECPEEIEMLLDGRIQPAASVESGQNKSHNIKAGSAAWTGNTSAAGPAITKGPEPAVAAAAAASEEEEDEHYSDYESSSSPASSKFSHSEDEDEF